MHEYFAEEEGEEESGEEAANEPLPGLFGRQFYQTCAAEPDAEEVGEHIIGDHQHAGQNEPDEPFLQVVHHNGGLRDHQQQTQVGPAEVAELVPVVALLERQHTNSRKPTIQSMKLSRLW